jgi:hypothetical protein
MCDCIVIGRGVQVFRIRDPAKHFDKVADVGALPEAFLEDRQVWKCRGCGELFAWMRIPFKDTEEIIVRARSSDWHQWRWAELAEVAGQCRWRGPQWDPRHVL